MRIIKTKKGYKKYIPFSNKNNNFRKLFPWQIKAFRKFKDRDYLALFMEMRLGKSTVSIRWMKQKGAKLILLIAPKSSIPDWEKELNLEGIDSYHQYRIKGKEFNCFQEMVLKNQNNNQDSIWCISNIEHFHYYPEFIFAPWNGIILDESTKIKNPKADITKLLVGNTNHIKYKAILSGLPSPEGDLDFFCQFKFLFGHFIGEKNYWNFRDKYFMQSLFNHYDWIPKKNTRSMIKKNVYENAYIASRKDFNIGSTKLYKRIYLDIPKKILSIISEVKKTWEYVDIDINENDENKNGNKILETKYAPELLIWLHRLASGFSPSEKLIDDFKIKELYRFWKENLNFQKVVIWCKYNIEILEIKKYFENQIKKERKITKNIEIIYGNTANKKRKEIQDKFNNQFKLLDVLICQVKCNKYGFDLSGADTAIYFSNPFSNEDRLQTEDRIVHPEKKIPLLIVDMISSETVDEDIYELLIKKKINSKFALTKIISKLKKSKLKSKLKSK